jgi:sortase A
MNRLLKFLERLCLITGLALITLGVTVRVGGMAQRHAAVAEFERLQNTTVSPVDQLNWSPQRIADYQEALQQDAGDTLRIPSRNIEVPVFNSTDEWALNRGSGHVTGTSLPGERGNIAIAAHRDGFFRSLENIEIGDEVELTTLEGHQTFRVSQLDIVDPLDVSVLEPTDDTMVTLITCYPFYYVGAAPDRFIVRAALTNKENNDENT